LIGISNKIAFYGLFCGFKSYYTLRDINYILWGGGIGGDREGLALYWVVIIL